MYRNEEFVYNLDVFYKTFRSLLYDCARRHYSFKYMKSITDYCCQCFECVYCWELFAKDIGTSRKEFAEGKLPEKERVFKWIVRASTFCLCFLLSEEERLWVSTMLLRWNFEGVKKMTDETMKYTVRQSMLFIMEQVDKQNGRPLYDLYRDSLQEILNNMRTIKEIAERDKFEDVIFFDSLTDPVLRHSADLFSGRVFRSFVLVCTTMEFKKYISSVSGRSG